MQPESEHLVNTDTVGSTSHADLCYLPLISLVRTGSVVRQSLGACEFVVGRRRRADVAMTGDLSSKPSDGTSHLGMLAQRA